MKVTSWDVWDLNHPNRKYIARGTQIWACMHWIKIGDQPTKSFFKSLVVKEASENISALKVSLNQTFDQEEIERDKKSPKNGLT